MNEWNHTIVLKLADVSFSLQNGSYTNVFQQWFLLTWAKGASTNHALQNFLSHISTLHVIIIWSRVTIVINIWSTKHGEKNIQLLKIYPYIAIKRETGTFIKTWQSKG